MICHLTTPHCVDCGSTYLHEGPNDPPPWCCCEDCGSCDVGDRKQCIVDHKDIQPCTASDCGNPNHSELEHWGGKVSS